MPRNEESVVAQGSEEMRSPLFEKSVRKADSIHQTSKSETFIDLQFSCPTRDVTHIINV